MIEQRILYEDNHIIIFNKLPGEIVQGDKTGDEPLVETLKQFIKQRDAKPGAVFLGVVHRLDRPVGGVVIFAKTSKALARLNEMLRLGQIHKTYWALSRGLPPQPVGELTHYITTVERINKSTAHQRPKPGAKEARLRYRLLAQGQNFNLLEINLLTGRKHQIRVQLSAIGCPIRGDLKYGDKRSNPDGSISLLARHIEFEHPVKHIPISVTAPVPDERLWQELALAAEQSKHPLSMTKQDLRIVFLGTPDFAVESLNRLVEGGYNVVGVITMPDKPAGRGHHLLQSAVKQYAVAQDLKVMQPVSLRDPEFLEELRSLRADLFIVIAFRMLPREVWQMPPLGTFNLHASLLPRYRGAAPINRAVMNGDTETGVTTFMLKHEIDTGDILQQQSIQIGDDENVGSVHDRLMMLGAELTIQTVDHIIAGDLSPIPQDQLLGEREATPAPKIFSDDCVIDWTKPATEVHNHVRGLSPYPAARSVLVSADGSELSCKILATRKVEGSPDTQPGHILCADKKLVVACADSTAVEVLRIQPAGKKAMDTEAWLRGFRLAQDAQFVEKLGK